MIFRQLFDRETCTYTYLLGDEKTREAVLIDTVIEQVERDLQILEELDLKLKYCVDTHIHADHVTGAGVLREKTGCTTAVSRNADQDCADIGIEDGKRFEFGEYALVARETPGHTDTCVSYILSDETMAFTGDTLFVRGCGRTDFQSGSADTLYDSVHGKLFSLPETCAIYPGHDYKGRTRSTVAEEKAFNPRLGGGKSKVQFIEIMDNLKLSPPKRLDVAVPANLSCGMSTSS